MKIEEIVKELFSKGFILSKTSEKTLFENARLRIKAEDEATAQIKKLIREKMPSEAQIEEELGKIEIPIDTNIMEVKETTNPAVIILKNRYGTIIARAIHNLLMEEM